MSNLNSLSVNSIISVISEFEYDVCFVFSDCLFLAFSHALYFFFVCLKLDTLYHQI